MKTSAITAIAATAFFAAPTLASPRGRDLDWVPECGVTCVERAVAAQGCDPNLQECYCGRGFFDPWYACVSQACSREDLPNGYIWGFTRCDPKTPIFIDSETYDLIKAPRNETTVAPVPTSTGIWSASPSFVSDRDWVLETPHSVKSNIQTRAIAEETAVIVTETATRASATGPTATSTKPATVTDSGSVMIKASMASIGLASVAAMFLAV
ncbi:unnamed protein product [Fusarium graminearum]|uniref:CFEM domain-containing protein n=1 Tax=Gibberella zeae TaxID=5518 RepID=A0A2H3GTI0_GIBZA|nr:hypothetical protein HG531_001255 [Fusarium graminearum]PCD27452.1 hypothetical protein FGRA07_02591 [Fusarium graminearum]CAG2003472.1 unnamed protein product [Fusarium graminearum]CAG2005086.1 unnamed protein product [Fusarium graminearum]CZS81694.1 unnamed protein product [Fusarium graminearum]